MHVLGGKGPPLRKRGEVTNLRKNRFVGEYHLLTLG